MPEFKRRRLIAASFLCLRGMAREYLFQRHTPLAVGLHLTYRCNTNCRYCGVVDLAEPEMTTAQILRLIDEFVEAGVVRVGLTGGEPLLREDIGEIIKYSKSQGIITTINSNGILVPEKINELKGIDIIILSLDGPQEINDRLRGSGVYEKVKQAISSAQAAGIEVWISMVMNSENIDYYEKILELAKKYRIKCSFQLVASYSLASAKVIDLLPAPEKVKEVFTKLIEYKKSGYPIGLSLSYLQHIQRFWPELNKNKLACFAGRLFCVISPGGYVFPCQPGIMKKQFPNVLDSGFTEAFNRLPEFNCKNCFCDSFIETNLLFSGHLGAMWERFKMAAIR